MRKLHLLLVILLCGILGYSQKNDTISNPLERFFQENYDSSIFYHSYNVFENKPEYYILGKKDDTIYYYHYYKSPTQQPTRKVGPSNSGLINFFIERYNINSRLSESQSKISLDDNFYWVKTEILKGSTWETIQNQNLWNLKDDSDEILKQDVNREVIDGKGCFFKLITNDKVNKLTYWNPDLYPKSNKNNIRNRIVEIERIIDKFYSTNKVQFLF